MSGEHAINKSFKLKVGFDAKRYFNNTTGLGNYSRWVVNGLNNFNDLDMFLFSPNTQPSSNQKIISPLGRNRFFKSLWRIKGITKDLIKHRIAIYHGLSNELPFGIHKTNIKTVVTIHDLINLRYPQNYSVIDRLIYKQKLNYAQKHAHKIIAPSEQTKKDLIAFFGTDEKRIEVIPLAAQPVGKASSHSPITEPYILCVSSYDKRKNLVNLVQAYKKISNPKPRLVIAGKKGDTTQAVVQEVADDENIHLYFNVSNQLLADFYQNALFCVYPSVFEGFGIPILEAFSYGKTIATSHVSSMPEVGGNAAHYFDPLSIDDISATLIFLLDEQNRNNFEKQIPQQLSKFSSHQLLENYVKVYKSL